MKKTAALPLLIVALSFAPSAWASSQAAPNVTAASVADENAKKEALSAIKKIEASMKHRHEVSIARIEYVSGPTQQERKIGSKPFEKTIERWDMTCDGAPQTYEVSFWTTASGRMVYSVRLPSQ